MKKIQPYLVYSDGRGNLFEDKNLFVAGRSGFEFKPLYLEEMIELPEGSDFFELPGRKSIGFDKQGNYSECEKGIGAAVFIPPAYTQYHLASYKTFLGAPVLPLFAYSPIGWYNNKYYTSAVRIDPDIRQENIGFNHKEIIKQAKIVKQRFPKNRLVNHIVDNCALTYFCPAARNFVLGRFECPIPSSPTCNADCIGCISFQDEKSPISCTQHRLSFTPTPEEIQQFAVYHLENATDAIVSFGQGCEGEPLLEWKIIRDSIIEIRKKTTKGIININTNGSNPKAVEELCKVGLNSIRISMNSARENVYTAYYRPKNYSFSMLSESAKIVRKYKGWVSVNYFVMPGIIDLPEEYEAFRKFIKETDISMIQWRNFNIDPDWILDQMQIKKLPSAMGIKELMNKIKIEFPHIYFGYFNPPERIIKQATYYK